MKVIDLVTVLLYVILISRRSILGAGRAGGRLPWTNPRERNPGRGDAGYQGARPTMLFPHIE